MPNYITSSLSLAGDDFDRRMIEIHDFADRVATELAGSVLASRVIDVAVVLSNHKDTLAAYAALPGMADHMKAVKNDPAFDVVAAYQTVLAALQDCIDQVVADFPTHNGLSTGYLLRETWTATGPVDRTFTTGATATLKTKLETLRDTIVV